MPFVTERIPRGAGPVSDSSAIDFQEPFGDADHVQGVVGLEFGCRPCYLRFNQVECLWYELSRTKYQRVVFGGECDLASGVVCSGGAGENGGKRRGEVLTLHSFCGGSSMMSGTINSSLKVSSISISRYD